MKITEADLRKIISEELLRGVPEFVIRQASSDCVDRVRQHVTRFIQQRAENQIHARELTKLANQLLEELEDEMYDLIEDKLLAFVQRT